MIGLGSTEFLLAVPSLPRLELTQLSNELFDSWELHIESSLELPDYSLFLQVEEGSIKGMAKIGALLGAVYFGIGNYGDFVSGVKTIREQLSATSDYLAEHAGRVFSCPSSSTTMRKQGGALGALQRLFIKMQKGVLTPDEAMLQAETLFANESAAVLGFLNDLENSSRTCPRFHEQLQLPLSHMGEDELYGVDDMKRPTRLPRPKPALPSPLQFRVEVWRESKKTSKQTKVIQL